MSKKEKPVQMNQRLKNAKMEEKFKTSFKAITVGMIVIVAIAIINILLLVSGLDGNFEATRRAVIAIVILAIATFFMINLCRTVAKSLSYAIVVPLRELQGAVQKLKVGELDIEITYDGKDEIGELAEDIRETGAHLHTIIKDAGFLMSKMSEGYFDVNSSVENYYVGDFKAMLVAMDKLNSQMDNTLCQIREASEKVMNGSEQMAANAHSLAEGATNQAGAIEELTSTIDDITGIAEASANNAKKAAADAKEAAVDAEKSREEIRQLTEAMERITETSKEIENIIEAIEDIASQTNLLSLNASIEAARAGEAGKGFAVVADQIGKLATDSAQSAVTTRELISKSLTEVEEGNRIVESTMASINTVLTNMEAFSEMAAGVADASGTQADMLKQIDAGIEQISAVVQTNTAAAQETSAVSEELSTQSESLEAMVEKFVLRKK
ncbi:MAG: HAMP domain-containing protein [Lachnospiraceae bacterium]|nr:HAMP domain-containing protein [Lachnospiraceae bacterium]